MEMAKPQIGEFLDFATYFRRLFARLRIFLLIFGMTQTIRLIEKRKQLNVSGSLLEIQESVMINIFC